MPHTDHLMLIYSRLRITLQRQVRLTMAHAVLNPFVTLDKLNFF